MSNRRRRTHKFIATAPNGERGRINVLAYGKDQAINLLRQNGYSSIAEFKPAAKHEVNKAAVMRLARSWGIEWDIKLTIRHSDKGNKNGSIYAKMVNGRPVHYITISPLCDNPERTIRHELGHAVYNENQYKGLGCNFGALAAAQRREHKTYEYLNRPTEIAARFCEEKDLHIRLTK